MRVLWVFLEILKRLSGQLAQDYYFKLDFNLAVRKGI